MDDLSDFLWHAAPPCLGLAAAEGLFLFGIKKKQKMPAENFSFKVSYRAWLVEPKNLLGRI
ncbi:hypothetical protein [Pedobacter terrae]|uniref:hypothetical protein n=1 Tax=Pedobacter terrae TaxID=405671 RepID=UPI002FF5690E